MGAAGTRAGREDAAEVNYTRVRVHFRGAERTQNAETRPQIARDGNLCPVQGGEGQGASAAGADQETHRALEAAIEELSNIYPTCNHPLIQTIYFIPSSFICPT